VASKQDTWTRRPDRGSELTTERAAPAGLPTSLRALRDAVLAGDPGCVCDPELFTGPAGIEPEDEPPLDRAARVDAARQVCAACPVQRPCLAYALRTRPAAGVWAGFTPEEITGLIAAAARPIRPRRGTALRPAVAAGLRDGRVAS
jgi:WhiB family redox-sensing transcriptional regulator